MRVQTLIALFVFACVFAFAAGQGQPVLNSLESVAVGEQAQVLAKSSAGLPKGLESSLFWAGKYNRLSGFSRYKFFPKVRRFVRKLARRNSFPRSYSTQLKANLKTVKDMRKYIIVSNGYLSKVRKYARNTRSAATYRAGAEILLRRKKLVQRNIARWNRRANMKKSVEKARKVLKGIPIARRALLNQAKRNSKRAQRYFAYFQKNKNKKKKKGGKGNKRPSNRRNNKRPSLAKLRAARIQKKKKKLRKNIVELKENAKKAKNDLVDAAENIKKVKKGLNKLKKNPRKYAQKAGELYGKVKYLKNRARRAENKISGGKRSAKSLRKKIKALKAKNYYE